MEANKPQQSLVYVDLTETEVLQNLKKIQYYELYNKCYFWARCKSATPATESRAVQKEQFVGTSSEKGLVSPTFSQVSVTSRKSSSFEIRKNLAKTNVLFTSSFAFTNPILTCAGSQSGKRRFQGFTPPQRRRGVRQRMSWKDDDDDDEQSKKTLWQQAIIIRGKRDFSQNLAMDWGMNTLHHMI